MKSFFKTVLAVIGCAIGLSASGQGITRNLMTTNSDPTVRTILTNIANQAANIATNQLAKANTNNFVKKGGDVMTGPLAIKNDDPLGALKVATTLSNSWITISVLSNAGGPQGDITGPAGQSIGFNAGGTFGISDSGDELLNMDPGSQTLSIGTFQSMLQFWSANGTGPKAVLEGPFIADLAQSTNYPVANGTTPGVVKPDGITTTVDVNGTITAISGSTTSTNTAPPSITDSGPNTVLYSSLGGTNNYWTNAPVITGSNIVGVAKIQQLTDATNDLNTALGTKRTDSTNTLNSALVQKITDSTNQLARASTNIFAQQNGSPTFNAVQFFSLEATAEGSFIVTPLIKDGSSVNAFDVNNRMLTDTNGTPALTWSNGVLTGHGGGLTNADGTLLVSSNQLVNATNDLKTAMVQRVTDATNTTFVRGVIQTGASTNGGVVTLPTAVTGSGSNYLSGANVFAGAVTFSNDVTFSGSAGITSLYSTNLFTLKTNVVLIGDADGKVAAWDTNLAFGTFPSRIATDPTNTLKAYVAWDSQHGSAALTNLANGDGSALTGVNSTVTNWALNAKNDCALKGDGSDESSGIQAAFDKARTNSRALYFPPGTYKSSQIITAASYVDLYGDGRFKSTLQFSGNSWLQVATTNINAPVYSARIEHIGFDGMGGANPAAMAVRFGDNAATAYADPVYVNDIFVDGFTNGLVFYHCGDVTVENFLMSHCTNAISLPVPAANGTTVYVNQLKFQNGVISSCDRAVDGNWYLRTYFNNVTMQNCTGPAVRFDERTTAWDAHISHELHFTECHFESNNSSTNGEFAYNLRGQVEMLAGAGGSNYVDVQFNGCEFQGGYKTNVAALLLDKGAYAITRCVFKYPYNQQIYLSNSVDVVVNGETVGTPFSVEEADWTPNGLFQGAGGTYGMGFAMSLTANPKVYWTQTGTNGAGAITKSVWANNGAGGLSRRSELFQDGTVIANGFLANTNACPNGTAVDFTKGANVSTNASGNVAFSSYILKSATAINEQTIDVYGNGANRTVTFSGTGVSFDNGDGVYYATNGFWRHFYVRCKPNEFTNVFSAAAWK